MASGMTGRFLLATSTPTKCALVKDSLNLGISDLVILNAKVDMTTEAVNWYLSSSIVNDSGGSGGGV